MGLCVCLGTQMLEEGALEMSEGQACLRCVRETAGMQVSGERVIIISGYCYFSALAGG